MIPERAAAVLMPLTNQSQSLGIMYPLSNILVEQSHHVRTTACDSIELCLNKPFRGISQQRSLRLGYGESRQVIDALRWLLEPYLSACQAGRIHGHISRCSLFVRCVSFSGIGRPRPNANLARHQGRRNARQLPGAESRYRRTKRRTAKRRDSLLEPRPERPALDSPKDGNSTKTASGSQSIRLPKVSDFPREWTTTAGKTFTGQLLQSDHQEVALVIDAKRVKFRLKALSPSDVEYIKSWLGPAPGMKPDSSLSQVKSDKANNGENLEPAPAESSDAETNKSATDETSLLDDGSESVSNLMGTLQTSVSPVISFWVQRQVACSIGVCIFCLIALRLCRKKTDRQRTYAAPDEFAELI
jgi:hypothetical protein